MINAYEILLRKREGKRVLGRPRRRWKDNIEMDHGEMMWKVVDWNHLAKDKNQGKDLVNTVMNFWVPKRARNFLTRRVTTSF